METPNKKEWTRKEEMENARKFRELDRQEITEVFRDKFTVGSETDWSVFNYLLYAHSFKDYSDDMDLLRKFYQRIYPSLLNLQRSNEALRDLLQQNFDKLNRDHKKIAKEELDKYSPFEMAQRALEEAGRRAKARAKSGIETYRVKVD